MRTRRPLWSCTSCGAKLVSANLSHSCGPHSVEAFLSGKGPHALALFAHVCLPRRLDHPRFTRIDQVGARAFVHHFRVATPDELDDTVLAWLRESYAMSEQRHLE